MNAYFYSNNGTQKGPVSYEDLKKAGIGKDILVWRDGFDDWQEAGNVSELSGLFTEAAVSAESVKQSDSAPTRDEEHTENEKPELDNTKMFKNIFLSEGTRRCHDLGHSGFWMLIPYYILWMLFQNSKVGPNEYGNNPKGENFERLY